MFIIKKLLIILTILFFIIILLILALFYFLRPVLSYLNKPANLKKAKNLGSELLKSQNKTFVVVVAHPDDAEWYAGGTLAMLSKSNRIVLIVGTSGEAASRMSNLGGVREQKQKEAGQIIGYQRIELLRLPDRGLKNNKIFRARLTTIFKEEKPGAIFTFDSQKPSYIYRHSDHQAAGQAAIEVSRSFLPIKSLYLFHSQENNAVVNFAPVKEKKARALELITDYGPRNGWMRILSFIFRLLRRQEPFWQYGMRESYPEIGVEFGELFRKLQIN